MLADRPLFPIENYIQKSHADNQTKQKLLQLINKKNVSKMPLNVLSPRVRQWLKNNGDEDFWSEVGIYSRRLDILKLAIRAGYRPTNAENFDFSILVGLEDTFAGDLTISKIRLSDMQLITLFVKEKFPIVENKTLIDALCWTGQINYIKWAMKQGFKWSKYSLFDCVCALCTEPIKNYEVRLKIIQLGVRHQVPHYRRYVRFQTEESLKNMLLIDDLETGLFILDRQDEIVDHFIGKDAKNARDRFVFARDTRDEEYVSDNFNPMCS
jgi:hypothetical protein